MLSIEGMVVLDTLIWTPHLETLQIWVFGGPKYSPSGTLLGTNIPLDYHVEHVIQKGVFEVVHLVT